MSVRILFTGVNSGIHKMSATDAELPSIAERLGHYLCLDIFDSPDVVICVDYDNRYKTLLLDAQASGVPLALVKQEPPVVNLSHRWENPSGLFNLVISRAKADQAPQFPAAQNWDVRLLTRDSRLNKIVAISADKWSSVPGELYSLRRKMYAHDSRIELFGRGWTDNNWKRFQRVIKELMIAVRHGIVPKLTNLPFAFIKPLDFKGVAEDKMEVLSRYHAALVIENDPTSLSEKVVDCLLAGTIPVYVGPPTSSFGIPEGLIIRSKADVSSLTSALDLALETDSQEFRSMAWSWASQDTSREHWSSGSVGARLITHIVRKTVKSSA